MRRKKPRYSFFNQKSAKIIPWFCSVVFFLYFYDIFTE